jgi:hypothetical protein
MAAARAAKEHKRLGGQCPDYCTFVLPELRREVIIIDHDFGTVTHHMKLYRASRIDTYRIEVDGKPWKNAGWAKAVEGVRKSFLRVRAI